jgi:hypothetical protein
MMTKAAAPDAIHLSTTIPDGPRVRSGVVARACARVHKARQPMNCAGLQARLLRCRLLIVEDPAFHLPRELRFMLPASRFFALPRSCRSSSSPLAAQTPALPPSGIFVTQDSAPDTLTIERLQPGRADQRLVGDYARSGIHARGRIPSTVAELAARLDEYLHLQQ